MLDAPLPSSVPGLREWAGLATWCNGVAHCNQNAHGVALPYDGAVLFSDTVSIFFFFCFFCHVFFSWYGFYLRAASAKWFLRSYSFPVGEEDPFPPGVRVRCAEVVRPACGCSRERSRAC